MSNVKMPNVKMSKVKVKIAKSSIWPYRPSSSAIFREEEKANSSCFFKEKKKESLHLIREGVH